MSAQNNTYLNFTNFWLLISVLFVLGCQENSDVNNLIIPSNLVVQVDIEEGKTGRVTVTPSAENALNYEIFFDKDTESEVIIPGESKSFRYRKSGKYSVLITVIAYGVGGTSVSKNIELNLDVKFIIPSETLKMIAGNGSKRWIWERGIGGHLGVGPITNKYPEYFSVKPNNLNPCVYDDVLVFSYDVDNNYSFELKTGERNLSYVNWAEITRFFPKDQPQRFADECRNITDQINTRTNFSIFDNNQGNQTLVVENSTMSYWSGAREYEILELTKDRLRVRGIQELDANFGGGVLAWYHTFVPETSEQSRYIGEPPFDRLVWKDEFDGNGALDPSKWNYVLGDGCPDLCGWGNEELQTYTDTAENIIKENGVLNITARATNRKYTSARINTKNSFEFTYGRVEIKAKLPKGKGTWPAFWMLGSSLGKLGWPHCGEIDIFQHVGNNSGTVWSSLQGPDYFGKKSKRKEKYIPTVSDEFHVYSMEWTSNKIVFSIDGTPYYTQTYANDQPFYDKSFYLVLNMAMGGNTGGDVDPQFSSATMEVDYIRVYQ